MSTTEAQIVAVGNEIREMKQSGASKDEVTAKVQDLLKLKAQYKEETGKDYAPAGGNAKKSSKKKEEKPAQAEGGKDGKKSKNQLKKEAKKAELAKKKQAYKDGKVPEGGKKKKQQKPKKLSPTARPEATEDEASDADIVRSQSEYMHASMEASGDGQTVTPWDVSGGDDGIDYDKLIKKFGCGRIDDSLIARMEKLTGHKAHRYLRRGFFFSQRDLKEILDAYEKGEKFYLYTGRGPSSGSLHMGHLIPFTFTAWLQKVFDVPLVVQLTNDEKFLFKGQTLEESMKMMWENAKDIIACGFDPKKTFIFADTEYIQHMYPEILRIQKCVTYNQVRGIFGFSGTDNIGKSSFPAIQAAPSFPASFKIPLGEENANMRCLIPQAIDQDPYFRMTRDVAPRLGYKKPALIHSKFMPALQGASTKMSASCETSTIYVSDDFDTVANKIKRYAFSGGGETKADHEKYGANLAIDIPYQFLEFMLEDDDELAHIAEEYGSGRMMSGEVKQRLIEVMTSFNEQFKKQRDQITDEIVAEYMKVRRLEF